MICNKIVKSQSNMSASTYTNETEHHGQSFEEDCGYTRVMQHERDDVHCRHIHKTSRNEPLRASDVSSATIYMRRCATGEDIQVQGRY